MVEDMVKRIVAIDPGTSCGWCVLNEGRAVAAGAWNLAPSRGEGAGMRYVRLTAYLRKVIETFRPDALAYEEVHAHLGTDAAHIYGAVVGVVQSICEELKVPYLGVPVGTVKKVATGKGNASKAEMIEAARREFSGMAPSLEGKDASDIADALWIARAAGWMIGDGKTQLTNKATT